MKPQGNGLVQTRWTWAIAITGAALVASAMLVSAPQAAAALPGGRYVVALEPGVDAVALARASSLVPSLRYSAALNGFAVKLTAAQATRLAGDARVSAIALDGDFDGMAQTEPAHVRSVEADDAPVSAGDGFGTWNGPAVAIIDSGVSAHPDYTLAGSVGCVPGLDASDGNGHGTAVAGYMAASDNGIGTVGVAPGAPVYSVRVMDANNKGTLSTILCGLDWVSRNAEARGIAVVNMSLAAEGADDGNCGYTNGDPLHQAICGLTGAGLVVVASAANSGTDVAGAVPGSYDEVLTATNIADYDGRPGGLGSPPCAVSTRDDTPSLNSNFAVSAPDRGHVIAAPGMCPYTTLKGSRYGYIQSGTSMAAAAVSGVVLDCFAAGDCTGRTPSQVGDIVIAQAAAAAAMRGHSFAGDPTRPVAGKYYGYLASTIPATIVPTPTPTPTPTPIPTPTPTPDRTPPTVVITEPAAGSVLAGSAGIRSTATDEVGVTAVTYWSGATRLGAGSKQPDGTWRATFDTRAYPNGTYAVTAKATDAAGNVGVSPPVSFTVRN